MFEISTAHEGLSVLVATENEAKEVCNRLNKELDKNRVDGVFEYKKQSIQIVDEAVNSLLPLCEDSCYFEERIYF